MVTYTVGDSNPTDLMPVYDMLDPEDVQTLSGGHQATVRDVHWHPYMPQMISSGFDGLLTLWDDCVSLPRKRKL